MTEKSAGRLGDRVVSSWSARSGRGTIAIGGTARRGQSELPRGIAQYQASRSGGETGGRTRSEWRLQLPAPCLEKPASSLAETQEAPESLGAMVGFW
jgi:hypothetical protein